MKRTLVALMACVVVSACSSGLPDPVMLQGALLSNNSQNATTTGSVAPAERSVASRVLTAVAIERVVGQPAQTFSLQ